MANKLCQEMVDPNLSKNSNNTQLEGMIRELSQSVSNVYKYELLTTNQYLKQMELVLEIFQELSEYVCN